MFAMVIFLSFSKLRSNPLSKLAGFPSHFFLACSHREPTVEDIPLV